ncbi:MAG TPA: cyclase family protein [Gemmatimonadales bacterium]|nr:cyclase family protein [Gemmatimonadales bacterium]
MVAGCDREETRELHQVLAQARWVDLSYAFNAQTIYWPTAEGFRLDTVAAGITPLGYYYAANNLRTSEHGGTHLDAPLHFAEGKNSADRIPLDQLVGPAVVVDVAASAGANPDYLVTVADLAAFERDHGRIPDGAILLVRTGWGSRWPDRARYLGTDRTGPEAVPLLHFPGIDSSAARWLVTQRRVDAVGIDTPSLDFGQSTTFETHRILYAANIPGFENVAQLDQLPQTGAFVIALPMKIEGGSGGPLRIVAVLPGP